MTGPGDEMAAGMAGRGRLRASDADREQVIGTLKDVFVQGLLDKDEFDLRVGQALAPRTCAELAALTADLPAGLHFGMSRAPRPVRNAVWLMCAGAVLTLADVVIVLMTLGAAWSAPAARDAAASSGPAPAPSTGPPARSATGGRPPPDTSRRTTMGHPDGAHTHGSGGSGLGELLVILLAVALLGPAVAAAVAELVHVLLIVAGVIVGAGAAGLAGLLAWQLRRTRVDAARTMPRFLRRWCGPLGRSAGAASGRTTRRAPA